MQLKCSSCMWLSVVISPERSLSGDYLRTVSCLASLTAPGVQQSGSHTETALSSPRRGCPLNVTNQNSAAKWLEGPRKLQGHTQDIEGQLWTCSADTIFQSSWKKKISSPLQDLLKIQLPFLTRGTRRGAAQHFLGLLGSTPFKLRQTLTKFKCSKLNVNFCMQY